MNWIEALKQNHILVGTPEVFRRSFVEKAFILPSEFSLIVFDECHNATGNSPMASIMRDSVNYIPESMRPRILGLTASFVNGSTEKESKIVKKRVEMETLFQATLYSPIIPLEPGDQINNKKYISVSYPDENLAQYETYVRNFITKVLEIIPSTLFDDIDKWVGRGWNIFQCLGAEGLR